MKNIKLILLLLFQISFVSCQNNFDREVWINNNNYHKNNPRIKMVNDLMNNHLKRGMNKFQIFELLGKPESEYIGVYLPDGKKIPDSLSLIKTIGENNVLQNEMLNNVNQWYKDNYLSSPMISYPLGWNLIDPSKLIVRLDDNDNVVDFYIRG